ncbi:hypothetical protein D9756_000158 [Leucocoprinus leucothites]|uniref:Uncharacterized protein n=1 Tax=Leucocoprinus leucothites TaxID=201217 RepID=A0A8H5LNH1_9AGAR|nr:hypothetical protein D9756_000158 [Leucoagaricus leucothites]
MLSKSTTSPRRTHRRRVSALHLSTDTTATLPEYHQASASGYSWLRHQHSQDTSFEHEVPSDKPPDYPDSAEEADEDTDSENHRNILFVHQLPTGASTVPHTPHTAVTNTSPRRKQRFYQHKRKHSAPTPTLNETSPVDPYLDSLLERSVHALEMSNTLLQSSMTTQTSLSTVFACDSPADTTLQTRAMNLSARIRGQWDNQPPWMDDLEEITKTVDSLFDNTVNLNEDRAEGMQSSGSGIRSKEDWSRHLRSSFTSEAGLSSSLPAEPSPLERQSRSTRKRPSLDLLSAATVTGAARLRFAHRTREELIAPPPRALTQYIESGADSAVIALPSTLGIRSCNSVYPNGEWNASTSSLHSAPALPVVTDAPLPSSSTPAYAKLASFVINRPSKSANATPSSSFTSSFTIKRRNSSAGSSERGRRRSSPQSSPRRSFETTRSHTNAESPLSHQRRPMTPPAEESSSSSEGCVAKQTISSLRKILDEQPPVEEPKLSPKKSHIFMPVTPPPAPVFGTSTATASISRMLTKKLHHSSTRPHSPPRSAMKGSRPTTPLSATLPSFPSSSTIGDTLTIPERISATVHSASSSGRSTPKRISFAELPEAHVSSRPEKFRDKGKRKGKGKGSAKGGKGKGGSGSDASEEDSLGWLATWFGLNPTAGVGATGMSYAAKHDERMEDRMNRSLGGRLGGGPGGGSYLDDWGV